MIPREHVVLIARCMLACVAGQVRAATHVVDQGAPGAADTNDGTEEKPFKTVQHAADVAKPGDTICVMAGRYDERDYTRFFGKGCVQRYNYYYGTVTSEIKVAHVDCIQTFMGKDTVAQDVLFEHNTCFDWGQGAMIESKPNIGSVRNWTWRHNIYSSKDPLTVDAANRNFRLRKGSLAAGAGRGDMTIGALEYPNVYYIDPRHPAAADEPPWGYPAVPLATLAKACAIAQPGETIVLRGGVYREVLVPKNDGVTIRAMKGEKVTISGADLIEGWKREADGRWSAPLAAEPKNLLRDGKSWSEFTYDTTAKGISVKSGGDPRLHLFETVVRNQGVELGDKKNVKVEGITVTNTLKGSL